MPAIARQTILACGHADGIVKDMVGEVLPVQAARADQRRQFKAISFREMRQGKREG